MAHVDLNLLSALDALLDHESVQDAAAQLHLTPPAMSRALGRLRAATGDDILVRNGRQMVPTPRALAMRNEVRELVGRVSAVLQPSEALDLERLEREFTIQGNDALLGRLAPALIAHVGMAAPGVTLRMLGENTTEGRELTRGQADLEVGGERSDAPVVRSVLVGHDRLAVVMRADHPLAARGPLGLDEFTAAAHVSVSRRGRLRGPVDEALAALGRRRHVVASLPSAPMALAVVRRTDLLTVAARELVRSTPGVCVEELPVALPPLSAVVSWHRRHDTDPAHAWLRDRVVTVLSGVFH